MEYDYYGSKNKKTCSECGESKNWRLFSHEFDEDEVYIPSGVASVCDSCLYEFLKNEHIKQRQEDEENISKWMDFEKKCLGKPINSMGMGFAMNAYLNWKKRMNSTKYL